MIAAVLLAARIALPFVAKRMMNDRLERIPGYSGRAMVPGCGHGHEVALAVSHGIDAIGLDIAPTGVAEARALYPHIAERFVVGDAFAPPMEMRGAFDLVLEHTCLSGLPPSMRADYRRGLDLMLKPGGLLIGVWFINPDLDPGEEGPPFAFPVPDLTGALRGRLRDHRRLCARRGLCITRRARARARAAAHGVRGQAVSARS